MNWVYLPYMHMHFTPLLLNLIGGFRLYSNVAILHSLIAMHYVCFSFLFTKVVSDKNLLINMYQGFLIASYKYLTVLLSMLSLFTKVVSDKNLLINMYQGFLIASYKYLTVLLSMPNANKMAYPNQRGGFTRRELLFFFSMFLSTSTQHISCT